VTTTTGTGLDRYGYSGTTTDPLTGLVGDDARQYDPALGRWTSDDPIGFGGGDANLARYVGNGPTNATDPSGLLDKTKPGAPPTATPAKPQTNPQPGGLGAGAGLAAGFLKGMEDAERENKERNARLAEGAASRMAWIDRSVSNGRITQQQADWIHKDLSFSWVGVTDRHVEVRLLVLDAINAGKISPREGRGIVDDIEGRFVPYSGLRDTAKDTSNLIAALVAKKAQEEKRQSEALPAPGYSVVGASACSPKASTEPPSQTVEPPLAKPKQTFREKLEAERNPTPAAPGIPIPPTSPPKGPVDDNPNEDSRCKNLRERAQQAFDDYNKYKSQLEQQKKLWTESRKDPEVARGLQGLIETLTEQVKKSKESLELLQDDMRKYGCGNIPGPSGGSGSPIAPITPGKSK
jgi:RHS repeat-associated protein